MRAAVITDLPGHELIIAITKFPGLRALTGSHAQHQIKNLPSLIFNCYTIKNVAQLTSISSVIRRYNVGTGCKL